MRIVKVNKDSIANILSDLLKRSPTNYGDFQDKVDAIIKNVRDNGDKAVFDYTAQFDKAEMNAENICNGIFVNFYYSHISLLRPILFHPRSSLVQR